MTHAQKKAIAFLEETYKQAQEHADTIDPKRRRNYERDPVLRALDVVAQSARHAVMVLKAR